MKFNLKAFIVYLGKRNRKYKICPDEVRVQSSNHNIYDLIAENDHSSMSNFMMQVYPLYSGIYIHIYQPIYIYIHDNNRTVFEQ